MDNAKIHKSKDFFLFIQTTNFRIIFNVPYLCLYADIELLFSQIKSKMNSLVVDSLFHRVKIAKSTIFNFSEENIGNCYEKSLKFILRYD